MRKLNFSVEDKSLSAHFVSQWIQKLVNELTYGS